MCCCSRRCLIFGLDLSVVVDGELAEAITIVEGRHWDTNAVLLLDEDGDAPLQDYVHAVAWITLLEHAFLSTVLHHLRKLVKVASLTMGESLEVSQV